MMPEDISIKALDAHVQGYISALRDSLLECDEEVINTLANMYRSGWRDADCMFRAWGMIQ